MRRAARLLSGALLVAVGAVPAAAAGGPRTLALLVGCTTYPFLARSVDAATYDARVRLRGPAADVEAFADVLVRTLGVPRDDVTTLVGWDDAAPLSNPTRENVLRGLVRLARRVAPGDRVVFLFAGHGSRVPDASGDEADGLDEVLLPADVRAWEPEGRRVPGAILDDELGEGLRAIRDAGATVWAVLDCCHAGTMTRGGDGPTRARHLPPALLGAPAPVARGAVDPRAGAADGDDRSGLATTCAVGAGERAVEMRLPRGAADAPWHGLLSYALVEDLRRTQGAGDLRALGARLAAAYVAAGFHDAAPVTEGDAGLSPSGPGPATAPPRDLPALAPADLRLRIARVDARGAAPSEDDPGPRFDDPRFPFVPPADADWLLVHEGGGAYALRPAASGAAGTAWVPVGADGAAVVRALEQVVRVENLVRLAASGAAAAADLEVRLTTDGPRGPAPLLERGALRPGDRLRVDVRNAGPAPLDVWVFFLDAACGVGVLAPGEGEAARLRPGASFAPVEALVSDATLGVERVLAVAVPSDPAAPPVDLRWLAAPTGDAAALRARAPGGGSGLAAWLAAHAFPDAARPRGAGGGAGPVGFRLRTFTTAWGALPVPSFPRPPGAGARVPGPLPPDADPKAWLAGTRVGTAAVASGDAARPDVVWAGAEAVEVVGVDPRGVHEDGPPPPVLLRFLADGTRLAAYDLDLDGRHDLLLSDRDGDGVAERRATRRRDGAGERWVAEEGVDVPWLRVARIAWPDDATAARAVRALRSLAP